MLCLFIISANANQFKDFLYKKLIANSLMNLFYILSKYHIIHHYLNGIFDKFDNFDSFGSF